MLVFFFFNMLLLDIPMPKTVTVTQSSFYTLSLGTSQHVPIIICSYLTRHIQCLRIFHRGFFCHV